jgi:hypothetical protein
MEFPMKMPTLELELVLANILNNAVYLRSPHKMRQPLERQVRNTLVERIKLEGAWSPHVCPVVENVTRELVDRPKGGTAGRNVDIGQFGTVDAEDGRRRQVNRRNLIITAIIWSQQEIAGVSHTRAHAKIGQSIRLYNGETYGSM